MDSIYTKVPATMRVIQGKENAVSSVQKYVKDAIEDICPNVFYDIQTGQTTKKLTYPCVVIDQTDFYSDFVSFLGSAGPAGKNCVKEQLQMYFRCVVNLSTGGTKPKLRRLRDLIIWVITHAGAINRKENKFWLPPIPLLDFGNGQADTGTIISAVKQEGALQDRFVTDYSTPHIMQYDVLARFSYMALEQL